MSVSDLRGRLADLAAQSAKTKNAAGAILAAARQRLDVVEKRIAELRPQTITDQAAGDEYQELILERGRLHLVMAQGAAAKS